MSGEAPQDVYVLPSVFVRRQRPDHAAVIAEHERAVTDLGRAAVSVGKKRRKIDERIDERDAHEEIRPRRPLGQREAGALGL